jgi:hypothetical protein
MVVKLGLSHCWRYKGNECSRIGLRGTHLGPRRDEVAGEWRRLHIMELYDMNSSLDFIRVFKSRRTRWTGYVVCMGEKKCIQGFGGET